MSYLMLIGKRDRTDYVIKTLNLPIQTNAWYDTIANQKAVALKHNVT